MGEENENQTQGMETSISPSRVPSMPGTPQPLQPISLDRQNQRRIPQSPSLPLDLNLSASPRKSHQPRVSDAADVKARIAFLNSVSQNGSPIRSNSPTKLNTAAMQRAMLGREEAETALNGLAAQLDSAKARERLVSERVENLMEQLTEARNRQRHERTVYEKEMKHSKKAEYKAELAVIKLQEDLREVRSELEGYKARSEHDKTEKEKARQEAFERAYAVAGMTEEMEDLKQRLQVAEQERDAAIAMAASRMAIDVKTEQESQLPKAVNNDQQSRGKRKQPVSELTTSHYDEMDLDDPNCSIEIKYDALKKLVDFLKRQVTEGEETVQFMNMQCQFKACPCRLAERDGVRFVHDYEYDAKVRDRNAKKRKAEQLEPQLPPPVFKSWRQQQAEAKGRLAKSRDVAHTNTQPTVRVQDGEGTARGKRPENASKLVAEAVVEIPAAPLPPTVLEARIIEPAEQSAVLDDAMNIPLPSTNPNEVEASDETLEPTAQLEEMTQVIIEPADSTKNFLFSTSTASNLPMPEPVHTLSQSHNVRMSDDLFDISPPKRHLPPRPSTAMGVLTIDSPVRLVQNSPRVPEQRSVTPGVEPPRQTTTRIALNDTSAVRPSRTHRQHPKPITTDRSRGKSPAPHRNNQSDRSSPAPSTLFPITPITKHERRTHRQVELQERPQTSQGYYTDSRKEVINTTRVPLRDESEQAFHASMDVEQTMSASSSTPFSVPGTPNMTREAALAQIRARRDRARSINMRKSAEDGSKTPGSAARRGVNLKDRLGDAKERDFSQASAPGRI